MNYLENLFFNELKDKRKDGIEGYGEILERLEDGFYLVRYKECFSEEDSHKIVKHIKDMERWYFYDNEEEMDEDYNRLMGSEENEGTKKLKET